MRTDSERQTRRQALCKSLYAVVSQTFGDTDVWWVRLPTLCEAAAATFAMHYHLSVYMKELEAEVKLFVSNLSYFVCCFVMYFEQSRYITTQPKPSYHPA